MVTNHPAIWPSTPHTIAKHRILRGYLDAYFPILSRGQREPVSYVDAFAGPGYYSGGEDGSPIVAMKAAIEHKYEFESPIQMHFIEARADRFELLESKVRALAPDGTNRNVRVASVQNSAADSGINDLLAPREMQARSFGPALFFLDQFGYAEVAMELITRIMKHRGPNCEVLSYLHVPAINRFLTDEVKDLTRNRVFGDETWREALTVPVERRLAKLVELYRSALKRHARPGYVWNFLMTDQNDEPIYWLFFCTHHPLGLTEMKKSMKRVDPTLKYRFSDRGGAQLDLLAVDDTWLSDHLSSAFSGQSVSLGDVERYVLERTPFWACRNVLKSMRKKKLLTGGDPRSIGEEGTILKFAAYQGSL